MDAAPGEMWQELLTAAVLGAGRGVGATLPAVGALGRLCAGAEQQTVESRWLQAAGVLAIYTSAGLSPPRGADAAKPPDFSADLPPASARSGSLLRRVLESQHRDLLVDWCAAAARAGMRAPDETLPDLLTVLAPRVHEEWATGVEQVLGARGRWLAGIHPEWRRVGADCAALAAAWEEAAGGERGRLLQAMRRQDPARARELVAEKIAEEDADRRMVFVAALGVALSPADEPFLEAMLDDGSKTVRGVAAELLSRLPESRLARRMAERSARLVRIERRRKLLVGKAIDLAVELPEASPELTRDGVENRKQGPLGNKAWMLAQIVGATPLATFTARGALPEEILGTVLGTEFDQALVLGWVTATARQGDPRWAEALLGKALTRAVAVPDDRWEAVVGAISPSIGGKLIGRALAETDFGLTEQPAWRALLASAGDWSGELTDAAFGALRRHFDAVGHNWDSRLKREPAGFVAAHADPRAAAEAVREWTRVEEAWSSSTRKWADDLLALLQVRRDYLKELLP